MNGAPMTTKPLFPDQRYRTPMAVPVPRRLRPSIEVSWETGHKLRQLGVPADGVEAESGKGKPFRPQEFEAFLVPECCAEVLLAYDLSNISLETRARLAADVYFEEVKGASKRKTFVVGTGQAANAIKRKLERAGHKGSPGKDLSTLYSLTQAEAENLGFSWDFC